MKTINICKADHITETEPVEDAQIIINNPIPKIKDVSLEESEQFYKDEALRVYDILFNHTAQGMRHQLLILMLEGSLQLYRGKQ